jgi:hypothetical protein
MERVSVSSRVWLTLSIVLAALWNPYRAAATTQIRSPAVALQVTDVKRNLGVPNTKIELSSSSAAVSSVREALGPTPIPTPVSLRRLDYDNE